MTYFYVITPVSTDTSYLQKRRILEVVGNATGCRPFLPLEHHATFSLPVARDEITRARFVVADLSLERPSCYFELGLAEALGKRTGLIAGVDTRIHQVEQPARVRRYSDLVDYRRVVEATIAELMMPS